MTSIIRFVRGMIVKAGRDATLPGATPALKVVKVRPDRLAIFLYDNALGIIATNGAIFESLKATNKSAKITVFCDGFNYEAQKHCPYIDEFVVTPSITKEPIKAILEVLIRFTFSTRIFDAILLSVWSSKPRIKLLSRLVWAKSRYTMERRSERDTSDSFKYRDDQSVVNNNRKFAEKFGDLPNLPYPRIFWTREDDERAESIASGVRKSGVKLVGLATQSSRGQPSEWYGDRFCELLQIIKREVDIFPIFFGTKADKAEVDKITHSLGFPNLSLAGETSVPLLAAIISKLDLVVSLDTGIMHVAAGNITPLLVIAPAWQPSVEWLPVDFEGVRIVRRWDIPCQNCRLFSCATRECMDEIVATDVATEALQMLRMSRASVNRTAPPGRWVRQAKRLGTDVTP